MSGLTAGKMLSFIRHEDLIRRGDRIVVGVSGGPDSVCLLHCLHSLRHELGLHLVVAHFDHKLRRGSSRDRRFVQKLAADLGLKCVSEENRRKIPATGSLEEFARNCRYAFFAKVVRAERAGAVAVGHSADDLAETVLMRILRGTGTTGMRAILPKREINGLTIVRPLLAITRREIEKYNRAHQLPTMMDPTNRSDEFFRNRVRQKILPFLEREAGDVRKRLAVLARIAAMDQDYIDHQAGEFLARHACFQKNQVILREAAFERIHPCLQRAVIRQAIRLIAGDLNAINVDHIEDAIRVFKGIGGGSFLPKGLYVSAQPKKLVIRKKSPKIP